MDGRVATDLPTRRLRSRAADARVQLALALVIGTVSGLAVLSTAAREFAVLSGWDAAALAYLVVVWVQVHDAGPERTAELAVTEYPGRAATDLLVIAAAVVSLATVVLVLSSATHSSGPGKVLRALAAVVSVTLSWALVHVVHALTYARLYYSGGDGGIDFNDDEAPQYIDFAYLAFTIGMTFQVSDTSLTSRPMRAVALRHSLLSYLFGAVIIATTINFIVTLGG